MTVVASQAVADTVNFDKLPAGMPPPGWTATKTGTGTPKWTVERDDSAPSKPNVLKQSGQATYPVCIKDDTNLKDGFVEVKFKPISGKEDQAGGVIWRAKDANNYYIARANALEDNVTIYHTINGRRTEKKRTNMKVTSNEWHTCAWSFRATALSYPSTERRPSNGLTRRSKRPAKLDYGPRPTVSRCLTTSATEPSKASAETQGSSSGGLNETDAL
jgi:hypothetical protein